MEREKLGLIVWECETDSLASGSIAFRVEHFCEPFLDIYSKLMISTNRKGILLSIIREM